MLSKSFKSGKCKTSLKLAVSRIKLLKNRREVQVKQLRRELAQLLATGQEQTARIRVEHVIREQKTMSAYDLIEIYCELIVARLPIIESQKSCPIDLKEAISSVIFASPRCADLPELTDARKHFKAKYGKEFVTSALELRPNSGVNRMIVEKLSAKAPETETKIKILTAIAKEHEVKWDSKAFEEELEKPKEDLLNGSSSFSRNNKIPMEPLNVNFSSDVSQTESASKVLQTHTSSKPTGFSSSSHTNNLRTSTPLAPPAPNDFTPSDRKAAVLRDSFLEFKDAASAAQAAAESAERASMAARAAAELASRGNISKQTSNKSNVSSIHVNSKLKGEGGEHLNMEYDQEKGFLGVKKEEVHKLPRDELSKGISHHSRTSSEEDMEFSSRTDTVKTFDGFRESFSRKELTGSQRKNDETADMEFRSQMDNVRTFDGFHQSSSRKELMGSEKKEDRTGFLEENVQVSYDRSASAGSFGTLDDNSGQNRHAGERIFRYDDEQHVSSYYAAPVFDEYGPQPTDDKENLLDSIAKKQDDQPSIFFAPTTSAVNPNVFSDSGDESRPVEKVSSSKFEDDSMSVTFDDSDSVTSESEDEMNKSPQNRTFLNNSLQLQKSDSSNSTAAKPLTVTEEKNHLQLPSSSVVAKDPEMSEELSSEGEFGLKFGRLTGGLRNRGYNHPPYTPISVIDSQVNEESNVEGSTSRRYREGESPYDSTITTTTQVFNLDKPQTKAYEELSSGMSKIEFQSGFVEERESPVSRGAGAGADVKLSRRTRDLPPKGRSNPTRFTGYSSSDASNLETESRRSSRGSTVLESPSQTTVDDEATTFRGKRNLKSSKPDPSGESLLREFSVKRENKKATERSTDPGTSSLNSGNNRPLDSGGVTKLQEAAAPLKTSHVHPKLPDYETLAAHFHSLRSNRR